MIEAACSAVVLARCLSKKSALRCWSVEPAAAALRAIAVFTPPGCTQVTLTPLPATAISWRSASVKPRTPNFAAL